MAAAETLAPTAVPNMPVSDRKTITGRKPLITESLPPSERVPFDPKKHLAFKEFPKTYTMSELGYPDSKGVSPVGVSEPFPLFTPEAIKQMRAEVLSDQVWEKYQYSSNVAQCQLRGFAPE